MVLTMCWVASRWNALPEKVVGIEMYLLISRWISYAIWLLVPHASSSIYWINIAALNKKERKKERKREKERERERERERPL